MSPQRFLRSFFGGLLLMAAPACAQPQGGDAASHRATAISNPAERTAKLPEPELAPPEPAPSSELDAVSAPRISSPDARTPAHQGPIAVFGQLATAQALIVTLLVAPFSTAKVEEPSASHDSTVSR